MSDLVDPVASEGRLLLAALLGIAVIVVLIIVARLHPFLALTAGALTVGVTAGVGVQTALDSYTAGFGSTAAGVGILIALGAMFGKLLADSGGADQIVDTIIGHSSPRALPWAMAVVGAIIGLPMFFEIGLVLLMPVIYLVARRSGQSLVTIGIPALAGLSAMHGLVPPHPGPLTAIDYLDANLGTTLALGVAVAIPTVIIAGPVFGLVGRYVVIGVPEHFEGRPDEDSATRPSFAVTLASVLLPAVLMMGKALADIFVDDEGSAVRRTLDVLGTPLIALLIAVVVGMFTLGLGSGMGRDGVGKSLESSLPGVAGILLIVSAGGGFKQSLVDTGIGTLVAEKVADSNISVLLLAWFVAVLIRLATGSATVATVTASGLLAPLTAQLSTGEVSLMVLAIGSGSVFFSHVNDAGFWLVKEYFGMTVGQTLKTWSAMETLLSVTGLVFVMALNLVI
ncbi:gluconate transporter [Pimelobacter simplex]|uniref:Gluconate transporter family protein n=1 Tax=Nocardioides simplex TaxID=2045 RepID=A0A0A1DID6_NOCSI|nr:gluconate:H+ symporter [Pimelobacter simplex]AIY16407.1 Gluconate transporter family protein [Pimelobacter simplex]MCG8152924.1 gluconate transporter [Pimelobacter simplex]GEB11892.1 gluconate:H+ symporter, GntP family protein [Pimelobacter simplex]SFN03105.1 gluconate:H+ symporter, GntP family [Pimelobacter simplex]